MREKTGDVVRTAFAVHTYHPVFEALVHSPRFVEPAEQLLQGQDLHPPVQDQRKGRLRRRRLAVAPGLRHLESRRRHARGARHEPRGVRRRGERVQRAAVFHPAEPQEGRDRGQARPHHDVLSAVGDRQRHHRQAGEAGRHRGAQGPGRLGDLLPRHAGARQPAQHVAVGPPDHLRDLQFRAERHHAATSGRPTSRIATSRRSTPGKTIA